MNTFQKLTVVLSACSLGGGMAFAEACSGIGSRVAAKPVVVHTAEDGTVTSFISNTGSVTTITPTEHAGTGWSHCTGTVVTKADKSASGSGVCFTVGLNGDLSTTSWEFSGNDRTWKRESGTGGLSGAASGTWEPSVYMAGGLGIGAWKGDCEF